MHRVKATLVNRDIQPGWELVKSEVPLGKVYDVDLDRIHVLILINDDTGQSIAVDCIHAEPDGYIPLALLQLEES